MVLPSLLKRLLRPRNDQQVVPRFERILDLLSFCCSSKVNVMRHRSRVHQLGKPADQRKALLRSLTTELIRHGRITTTKARAKAVREEADRMITLAKDGSLNARRRALGYIYDKQLVHALFSQASERYGDRSGGYTRIVKTVRRRGDNSEMAIIELT